jgi:hypothetical protein
MENIATGKTPYAVQLYKIIKKKTLSKGEGAAESGYLNRWSEESSVNGEG